MSRDIRSFFAPKNSSSKVVKTATELPKRRAIALSSDDDDDKDQVKGTPKEKREKTKVVKKRRVIESDDDDIVTETPTKPKNKKPNLSKLLENLTPKYKKETTEEIEAKFGHVPKRIERKKAPPKIKSIEHSDKNSDIIALDDDFNDSLIKLSENEFSENNLNKKNDVESPTKNAFVTENSKNTKKSPTKSSKNEIVKDNDVEKEKTVLENAVKSPSSKTRIASSKDNNDKKNLDVKKSLFDKSFESESDRTPKTKSTKKSDMDSSILTDEDRHERKRMSAILYQKYKNRSSAINPGSKEIPKGKPNCLSGLTFLVTGILESMERDEANQVIKDFGGKVMSTVGKRLNYMIVGEEAGPKKLATAEDLGVKIISEDGLFDLIREKSNMDISNKVTTSPKDKKHVPKVVENSKEKSKSPQIKTKKEKTEEKSLKRETEEKVMKVPNEKIQEKSSEKRKINDNEEYVKVKKEKKESPQKMQDISPKKTEIKEISKVDNSMLSWVDKYKPTNLKQIIGQQGAASNCVKLQNWLSKWYINHDGKKKLQKPNPWAKNDDGSYYKAALLSGPPGIGKTTTAHLVCKELGFDVVEFNASDTRSKKLLKEEVSELLSNKSLYGYFNGQSVSKKHALLMDEVDGMAGNEDRGGISELISLIKDSSIPIICMCNDRNHQKMRSLVNYCYDLRFNKPRLEQIRGPLMSICFKEKLKLPSGKIDEIISATNNDIRQTINHLSLLAAGDESKIEVKEKERTAEKDLKLGPWDVVRKVFTVEDQKKMNIHEKSDLFFNDYSLGPLFVQQNYLQVLPDGPKDKIPEKVALAADYLSLGDLIDKRIRSNSAWSLLPTQAMFSSVMPGECMSGHFVGQINFPGWLGKYSKANKRKRLAQELHDHTRIRTSGSRLSIRLDYAPFLLDSIVRPLKKDGIDGVQSSLNIIKEYRLLREDIESLIELTTWPGRKNPMDAVDGKVKAALTRAYNKEVLAYSYSAMAGVKKKKAEKMDDINEIDEENVELGGGETIISDNEDDDNIENDALIKAKKKPASKAGTSKETKVDSNKTTKKSKTKK
ncbi:replication factor C subunit 1 [Condylostylus longicornis]|uniref:replication factor C subunit 1 n=1 Tax=Condylostylus longicornis TaxID=2530218 RepID=UPI00244E1D56|nr:replication factor C subunit 1 [Condylostylus longicornis]